MTNYVNCKNSEGSGNYRKLLKSEQKNILLIFMGFTENNKGTRKRLYVSDLSFKATADHHKEHRYEEDCQQRCRDHSAALLIKSKVGWSLPNPPGGLS